MRARSPQAIRNGPSPGWGQLLCWLGPLLMRQTYGASINPPSGLGFPKYHPDRTDSGLLRHRWIIFGATTISSFGPASELASLFRIVCGKGDARMSWNWQNLVALTFAALLLGAAILANASDGPMPEHRGSWVTRALR
jgi:hypothetical protein